ncbi:endonuclease/exonuclease/phosphatase family metal-dependent hydrolase [Stackebrandtia endophytica]|uniref:Endonuclease/exonuclease/phosphatase family metal-dependent hydrolase n=1 Tax=Stackebrandtia endophytica TaxID=1496996 RepID=A0A543B385_9ACTN|nr:endonuclease/exonuclease/phosphatase family protein [Stackebrandtia endophytica]TQL79262.1 endonuclease/exonuclease/phosphatase family metal-dependent hydrolase [Stackebrandtia endophytica]
MRSTRYLAAVCTAVVAVVATLILAVSTGEADADPIETRSEQTYNVWLQNIAGWKMHRASTTNGLVAAVTASIRNRDADFVAFNEMCRQQYNAIIGELRAAGWPQDSTNFARFGAVRSDVCDGQDFGNAIFSRDPLGNAERLPLPDDGSVADHTVLCAPLQVQPTVRFCTTHITTSNEVIDGVKANQRQLDAANVHMEDYHRAGETVIIAGDFNAQPNYGRMNGWYSANLDTPNNSDNTGYYRELDDDDEQHCLGYGEPTVGVGDPPGQCVPEKKIDMIFVRENRIVGDYWADALAISQNCGGPCSDHKILIGQVTVAV